MAFRADNSISMKHKSEPKLYWDVEGLMGRFTQLAILASLMLTNACVHAVTERTGRLPLAEGREGRAPTLMALPQGFEEVALITVTADGMGTTERLNTHLSRRAALLGCDGIMNVSVNPGVEAQATCVKRREPRQVSAPSVVRVRAPSQALLTRIAQSGESGRVLLSVLHQSAERKGAEQAWPIKWYLQAYPQGPFAADVNELLEVLVPEPITSPAASVRGAPTAP